MFSGLNFFLDLFLWISADFNCLLLQSLVSHDPSEIILICRFDTEERFLVITNLENSCLEFFLGTMMYFFLFSFVYSKNIIHLCIERT